MASAVVYALPYSSKAGPWVVSDTRRPEIRLPISPIATTSVKTACSCHVPMMKGELAGNSYRSRRHDALTVVDACGGARRHCHELEIQRSGHVHGTRATAWPASARLGRRPTSTRVWSHTARPRAVVAHGGISHSQALCKRTDLAQRLRAS